jgi:hypothetical protein
MQIDKCLAIIFLEINLFNFCNNLTYLYFLRNELMSLNVKIQLSLFGFQRVSPTLAKVYV